MSGQRRCPLCGSEHLNDVAAAACTYRQATTTVLREYAAERGADPVAVLDLAAHLRAVMPDASAYSTTRYVLDLGWRPTVGTRNGGDNG